MSTLARRTLHEIRDHLRARAARLERSTFYDVLEITPLADYPEVEAAYQSVAMRYSPQNLAGFDLAELGGNVQAMWDLVGRRRARC